MKHILLPNDTMRPLPFYLAMEEVVAHYFDEDCFFTWIVRPTVIFGRNQVMENEVNLLYCKEERIQLVQRKSGGGCVYADEGNIMMSYITQIGSDSVEDVFARYLHAIVGSLKYIGTSGSMECQDKQPVRGASITDSFHTSGRNDILLGSRKISGSALYVTPDKRHAIAHGTLLHSTDIERMVCAITPSTEKLAKNGVQSIRQRVTNLTEHIDITIPELRHHLITTLCNSEVAITEEMIAEAEKLSRTYLFIKNE